MAPHPEYEVVADTWEHSYTRQKAAYPIESVRENKFWVNVARVDNTLGDRKLLPTCLWMLRLMKRKRNGLFYSKKEETINSIVPMASALPWE